MSMQTFEVRVEVKKKGSRHFSSHIGMYIDYGQVRMFHIEDVKTHEQAIRRASKYGHVLSCRKVDEDKMRGNPQKFLLPYGANNPYPNAIAMDEMIWKKKGQRAERLENQKKDKGGY
jgi:hypothetical protein